MGESFLHLLFFGKWACLTKLILGSLLLVGFNFILKKVLHGIRRRSAAKWADWKEKIDYIFYYPVVAASWIIGISFGFHLLRDHFGIVDLPYASMIRSSALVACASWMVLRWIHVFKQVLVQKTKHTEISIGSIQLLGRICNFSVVVLSMLLILQILGLNIVPLLAFGGIGAAALGFAAKDVIANFFGGVMLTLTRPFMEGDTILVVGKEGLTGSVEGIGLYMTELRDAEMRPVYLPNALFSTMTVVNLSRMTHRRILEVVKIRQEDGDKIPEIVTLIKSSLTKHPRLDLHLPIHVGLNEFGDYSLNLHIEAYSLATRFEEFLKVKQEILLTVQEILKSCSAELAAPKGYPSLSPDR